MRLEELNGADEATAAALVTGWADVPAWVDAVVAGRPYPDVATLAARAGALARDWDAADLDHALAAHPRIGERPTGDGAAAAASRREQAAMASADEDDVAAVAAGNAAYERRFGRVFLVRAAGRTPAEIRAVLERRLLSAPDAEADEALGQLAEIALLRLRTDLTEGAP